MRISRQLLDQLVQHAKSEAPNECCGMVAARAGEAVAVFRTRNKLGSPFAYEVHPDDQLKVLNGLMANDLDLGAIYHSHTRSAPIPSQTDINESLMDGRSRWPGTLYVIVGVAGDEPEVRAWSIEDGKVSEAELVVE